MGKSLTNAADPDAPPRPYRAFVEILKQLSSEDARFYNALFDEIEARSREWNRLSDAERVTQIYSHPLRVFPTYELVRIYLEANNLPIPVIPESHVRLLPSTEISVSVQNLCRLGLLPTDLSDRLPEFALMFALSTRHQPVFSLPVEVPESSMPVVVPKH